MKSFILDTDLDTDCDDIGALAVLHNLANSGNCDIAAVICNSPVESASLCARVVNGYFGHPFIPVGKLVFDLEKNPYSAYFAHRKRCIDNGMIYNDIIAHRYNNYAKTAPPASEAVSLYRKTLSSLPDKSVVICAIGLLNILADLMKSHPCKYSACNGMELIIRKVNTLVVMGKGSFPSGYDTFNWRMVPEAASAVLNNWPGKIVISPIGDGVLTGKSLRQHGLNNPISDAYKIFLKDDSLRPSWDQIAVLFAVLGTANMFKLQKGFAMKFSPSDGRHVWYPDPIKDYYHLELDTSPNEIADLIEQLMYGSSKVYNISE